MHRILIAAATCVLLAACGGRSDDAPAPAPAASTTAPAPAPDATTAPAATGGAFATPLPAGVRLTVPYQARMDVQIDNKGVVGRRTEYEFLDGNAAQAMADFAAAMEAAGFVALQGATVDDNGAVRQVFKRADYGTVFARAQNLLPGEPAGHPAAKGTLVVAWPRLEPLAAPAAP